MKWTLWWSLRSMTYVICKVCWLTTALEITSCHTTSWTCLILHKTPLLCCWAEALLKIARMTLTIKCDGNWSSFQLANSALPLSVTSSAIAPSARIHMIVDHPCFKNICFCLNCAKIVMWDALSRKQPPAAKTEEEYQESPMVTWPGGLTQLPRPLRGPLRGFMWRIYP